MNLKLSLSSALLMSLVPALLQAQDNAGTLALNALFTDVVLMTEEQVCHTRAPAEGKKLTAALQQWRDQNRALLDQAQAAASGLEARAYEKLAKPANETELGNGVAMLLQINAAKTAGSAMLLSAYAQFKDADAQAMCAEHAAHVQEAGFREGLMGGIKAAEAFK